jgi:hypothetical protein
MAVEGAVITHTGLSHKSLDLAGSLSTYEMNHVQIVLEKSNIHIPSTTEDLPVKPVKARCPLFFPSLVEEEEEESDDEFCNRTTAPLPKWDEVLAGNRAMWVQLCQQLRLDQESFG